MSHETDIINAYRAQLQKIREAYKTLNAQRYISFDDSASREAYAVLGDAIDSMEAQTIEDSAPAIPDIEGLPALEPHGLHIVGQPLYNPSAMINGLRFVNRTPHREE